jgi:hypothetical protein
MEELVGEFREVDSGLRLVVALKSTSWDIQYIRDDLQEQYTDEDFDRTYRSHMANQVSSDDLSHIIQGGRLKGQVYLLEDVIVFQFPSSRYEGFYISYDWTESFPIKRVIDIATEIPVVE